MQKFEITLKNEKVKLYNQISWLIIFINIIIFIYLAITYSEKSIRGSSIALLIVLTVCFFLKYYFRNTKYQFSLRPFFYIVMLGWLGMEEYWLAAFVFVFELLSSVTTRQLVVSFAYDKIIYPSFPQKAIKWDELNNTLLKDGLLTIDLKNNKLIQQMIDESKTLIDEKEFNDFCKEQLKDALVNDPMT